MQKVSVGSETQKSGANPQGDLRERKQQAGQANGTKTNGTKANGTKANGTKANGTKANGTKANGTKANGTKASGVNAKGAKSSGSRMDGAMNNLPKIQRVRVKGRKSSRTVEALTTASPLKVETPKQRARRLWGSGDYQAIAANLLIIAELLCETADLRAGQKVLDVATGTGNAALGAARRGCRTVGVDFAPSLLRRASLRAEAEGLNIKLVAGDAEALPFPDDSFDVVLSTLGVMFVSNQAAAAAELLRVTRPGGKIALANWTPDGGNAMVSEIVAKYLPAVGPQTPPLKTSPYKWGCADGLAELLGSGARLVQAERRSFKVRDLSATESWNAFQRRCGFVLHLMNSLDDQVRAQITKEVIAASEAMNSSGDGTLLVTQDYLEAVAIKTGG